MEGGTMYLLKYFDLNRRSRQAKKRMTQSGEANQEGRSLWGLGDRNSSMEQPRTNVLSSCWLVFTQKAEGQLSIAEQLLMYCGVLLGVYCSGVIRGQDFRPTLFLASVTALLIVPITFEKLNINPNAPLLVRFGLFVQNGVFWDVMLQAIGGGLHR